MSGRAAPFYCPYCGDERLEPRSGEGAWFCRDCVRSFQLKFLGVGTPLSAGTTGPQSEESES
ncbi:Insertion element protein [Spirillospora sp. NPDC052269]